MKFHFNRKWTTKKLLGKIYTTYNKGWVKSGYSISICYKLIVALNQTYFYDH